MSEHDEIESDKLPPVGSTRLFQITEDDLAELERIVPEIMGRHLEICNFTTTRIQFNKLKRILSNIRWDYGPPSEVHTLPFKPEGEQP